MNKIGISVIAVCLVLSGSFITLGIADPNDYPSIYIYSNSDFDAEHGVIGGDGTSTNPYIITGDIYYDVVVRDTTKYFKICDFGIYHKISVDSVSDHTCVIENIDYYNGELMNNWESVIEICDTRCVKILNCSIINWADNQTRGKALSLFSSGGGIPPENVFVKNCTFDAVNNVVCIGVAAHNDQIGHIFTECNFNNCHVGLSLSGTEGISVNNCTFKNHDDEAIVIFDTNNTVIENCDFSNGVAVEVGYDPILGHNSNLTMRHCNITVIKFLHHFRDGIIESCSFGGTISGIVTQTRGDVTSLIIRNNVFRNSYTGINFYNGLYPPYFGNVTNLQIYSNYFLQGSYAITFNGPTTFDNLIYNNYFSDELGYVYGEYGGGSYASNQIWNISKTPGANIIGGSYLGGNYWPDYFGRDLNGDGLGDTNVPHCGLDYLPLTNNRNIVPSTPRISGSTFCRPLVLYTCKVVSTDSDGDNVYYYVDWGDKTNSGWLGPYASGTKISASHRWGQQGTYFIKVKAKDVFGAESGWSTLKICVLPIQPGRPTS